MIRRLLFKVLLIVLPLSSLSACNSSKKDDANQIVVENDEVYSISKKGTNKQSKRFVGESIYHFASTSNYSNGPIFEFSSSFYGFYQNDFTFDEIVNPKNSYFTFDCHIENGFPNYRNGYGAYNESKIKIYDVEKRIGSGGNLVEVKQYFESDMFEPLSYCLDFHFDTFEAVYAYFDNYYRFGNDKTFYENDRYHNYDIRVMKQLIKEMPAVLVTCNYFDTDEFYETTITFFEYEDYLFPFRIKCSKTFIRSYTQWVSEDMIFESFKISSSAIPHSLRDVIKDVETIEKPAGDDVVVFDDFYHRFSPQRQLFYNTITPYLSLFTYSNRI